MRGVRHVHAPYQSIHTWKDFFIHIATIVIGLLIAVGLEQTMEYFHHRHQVVKIRAALDLDLRVNVTRFEAETEEFRRVTPILQTNLAVFQYLRQHPGAPRSQWPGKLDWLFLYSPPTVDAWKSAQQSGVLVHMQEAEVRHYSMINRKDAAYRASAHTISQPDASLLSPAQLDEEISLTTSAILAYAFSASSPENIGRILNEFSRAPTEAEIRTLLHRGDSAESWQVVQPMIDKRKAR
jgi:hypothetical protein